MSSDLRVERDGSTATITFDRPAAHNALTWEMYQDLYDTCGTIDADPGAKAFVAGTYIRQLLEFRTVEDGVAYEERIHEIVDRLAAVRVPTIAAIDGYVVGGGLVLAAACDLRVAPPASRFGLPIARTLGNCVSMSTVARLVALIGPARMIELVCTAECVDAERAVSWGLATELVAHEELEARVRGLCEQMASHAPLTMWVAMEALRRLVVDRQPDADDLVRRCYSSEDFREGVAAFVEKRPPVWSGR